MASRDERRVDPVQTINISSVSSFEKGLSIDQAPVLQPAGTYRFALNAVNNSNEGETKVLTNEESNFQCVTFSDGGIPIGSIYIGDNQTVVFTVNPSTGNSRINVVEDCNLTVIVDGTQLAFNIQHQIQGIYRLRRGCEKTIYFTDNYNPPRYFNLSQDKAYQFKTNGVWDAFKFELQKKINQIPKWEAITVENIGGNLLSGSYNFSIRYLDEELNATNWISISDTIMIYAPNLGENYTEIFGTFNSSQTGNSIVDQSLSWGNTNKAIRLEFSNLDSTYPYYQIGIIEATTGSGLPSKYSTYQYRPTAQNSILITSTDTLPTFDGNELLFSEDRISTAKSLISLDNQLILGNLKNTNIQYCNLQKYASQIVSQCVVRLNEVSNLAPNNAKSPILNTNSIPNDFGIDAGNGYMPGEVYAFGIVYVFSDGTKSPVYHIPAPLTTPGTVIDSSNHIYTMGYKETTNTYPQWSSSSCGNSYWGDGIIPNQTLVRHHKFPFRSEIADSYLLFQDKDDISETITKKFVQIDFNCNSGICNCNPLNSTDEDGNVTEITPCDLLLNSVRNGIIGSFGTLTLSDAEKDAAIASYPTARRFRVLYNEYIGSTTATPTQIESIISVDYNNDSFSVIGNPFTDSNINPSDDRYYTLISVQEETFELQEVLGDLVIESNGSNPTVQCDSSLDCGQDSGCRITRSASQNEYSNTNCGDGTNGTIVCKPCSVYNVSYQWITTAITNTDGTIDYSAWNKFVDNTVTPNVNTNSISGIGFSSMQLQELNSFNALKLFETVSLGIRFTNINIPTDFIDDEDNRTGLSIVGYQIVRMERTSLDTSVIDSGVMTPTIKTNSRARQVGNTGYIAPSFLTPRIVNGGTNINIENRVWNLITPRTMFYNERYNIDDIQLKVEGYFIPSGTINQMTRSRIRYSDVMDGSTYASSDSKKVSENNFDATGVRDKSPYTKRGLDGWCIKVMFKDQQLGYTNAGSSNLIQPSFVKYLTGLEYQFSDVVSDFAIFNTQLDQNVMILEFSDYNELLKYNTSVSASQGQINSLNPMDNHSNWQLPYVYLIKNITNPYENFLTDPYYSEHVNVFDFGNSTSPNIFSGDCYISSLKHAVTVKYADRIVDLLPHQSHWDSIWQGVIMVVGIVIGAVVTIFTLGAGAPIGLIIVAGAIAIAGAIALTVSNIVRDIKALENFFKAYADGLESLACDAWSLGELGIRYGYWSHYTRSGPEAGKVSLPSYGLSMNPGNDYLSTYNNIWYGGSRDGAVIGPSDDEIEYLVDCVTDLWFESNINLGLRVGQRSDSFLPSPGLVETGQIGQEYIGRVRERDGVDYDRHWWFTRIGTEMNANDYMLPRVNGLGAWKPAVSKLEKLTVLKLLAEDTTRNHGYRFRGIPLGDFRGINRDYHRRNKEKVFYHLSQVYDCCSLCSESFPHRIKWSLRSFQEELSDNFRNFLANDYKDILGETGEIVNIFKLKDHLYIHTEECLWEQPKNYQEETIDQLVTFIGTGDRFSIDARKIVESETGFSAGLKHQWSALIAEQMYFFVCEKERRIYAFSGEGGLKPISEIGIGNFFSNNGNLLGTKVIDSYGNHKYIDDNPSNTTGIGFISMYDNKKNRVIFTKKDYDSNGNNNSWTLSFSLDTNTWVSFHSYLPSFYFWVSNNFYSYKEGGHIMWKHPDIGKYQQFYGDIKPFIVDYVSIDPKTILNTKLWNDIKIHLQSSQWDSNTQNFTDVIDFFNKIIFYNTRQCSGILNTIIKEEDENWFENQTTNSMDEIIVNKVENTWKINDFRDIRVDYTVPVFSYNLNDLQSNYFIDMVLNSNSMDVNKDWRELENFRDKYLEIRLIKDTFVNGNNIKYNLNFGTETELNNER